MTSQEHFVFVSNPLLLSIKIPRQNWAAKSTLIATCEHSTCQAQSSSMKSAESGMRNAAAGSTRGHNHQDHCNHPRALGCSDTVCPALPTRQSHVSQGRIWPFSPGLLRVIWRTSMAGPPSTFDCSQWRGPGKKCRAAGKVGSLRPTNQDVGETW